MVENTTRTMSTPKNDGGSAFPWNANLEYHTGMSLRDYFAAKALPAIIRQCSNDTCKDGESIECMFTRKAYDVADAMLKARES
jgi:hypothetical protein